MKKTSTTTTDLIRYAYNETELNETVSIQHRIDSDYKTKELYQEVVETINYIDRFLRVPGTDCINRILDYSKSL